MWRSIHCFVSIRYMCRFHTAPLFCLWLTHYDILIEDLEWEKATAETVMTFWKLDIIQGFLFLFILYIYIHIYIYIYIYIFKICDLLPNSLLHDQLLTRSKWNKDSSIETWQRAGEDKNNRQKGIVVCLPSQHFAEWLT